MPVKEALTTLASAKLALGVKASDNSSDGLIEDLINAATEWIQQQCSRKFVRRNYNREPNATVAYHSVTGVGNEPYYRFSGKGSRHTSIVLPNYPVDSASITLEQLDTVSTAGVETWTSVGFVTNYDYIVDWETGILTLKGGIFLIGDRNYRVTYEAGYELPEGTPAAPWVPNDLQRCCNEVVKNMFDGNRSRIASEKIGTWTRQYDLSRDNPLLEPVINKYKARSNLI